MIRILDPNTHETLGEGEVIYEDKETFRIHTKSTTFKKSEVIIERAP